MASAAAVDFATQCYEGDWHLILSKGWLSACAARCEFPFAARRLIINNVTDRRRVSEAAQAAVTRGEIDEFLFAEDRMPDILHTAGIDRASFGRGYYYSTAPLASAFAATADYLLHFTSDAYMTRADDWIAAAVSLMGERTDILVANPTWDSRFAEAKTESDSEINAFYVGFGFSDQCFLVRPAEFRAPIYGYSHPASARYPASLDDLFEKRIDAYMRCTNSIRITHKTATYRHRNIPKAGPWRWLRRLHRFPSTKHLW